MSFDPYQILGVSSSASTDEVRRAYRGLARRYHPDVNDSPQAEEHFKLLAQAYSVISDHKRRALYDEFGEASLALGFDPRRARASQSRAPTSPRSQGAGGQPRPSRPGVHDRSERRATAASTSPDLHRTVEIDLATALRGGPLKVASPSGAVLTIELPPGVESGHRIRLRGRGRPGERGGLPGDLHLEIKVLPHPFFHREGHDLVLDLPISIEEAWRGGAIEIPTIEGWVRCRVPAGSRGGEKLRLGGKGLAGADGTRGDLFVHLCVRLPERLDAAARSLERLAGLYSTNLRAGLRL